jgi:hypothetical protein
MSSGRLQTVAQSGATPDQSIQLPGYFQPLHSSDINLVLDFRNASLIDMRAKNLGSKTSVTIAVQQLFRRTRLIRIIDLAD